MELTNIVRTYSTKVVQSWPKLIEPSQTKLTKMKQSNPKLTKFNYIAQVSKNLVGQNGTKLTKVTGTQSNEMKQNEPKWSEVEQSRPKLWDPVIQN